MKLVLTGGGTGGHIYPALSVAAALPDAELLFVGAAERIEARVVPAAGHPFRAIRCAPVERRGGLGAVRALGVNLLGVIDALRILREVRPAAVIGTGGFAAAGVMTAAVLLRLPLVMIAPDPVLGRVNGMLRRWSAAIACGSEETVARVGPRGVFTGVPIRPGFDRGDAGAARNALDLRADLPTLLVLGGSGGARRINETVVAALPELIALGVQVVHQSGAALHAETRAAVGEAPAGYRLVPFIEQMADALAAADLVLCRGGASTIAEVTAAGKPAIVVPYPYAVTDEQTKNAERLARHGAGELLREAELTPARLAQVLRVWLADADRLTRAAAASRALGRPDAAAEVADLVRRIAASRRSD